MSYPTINSYINKVMISKMKMLKEFINNIDDNGSVFLIFDEVKPNVKKSKKNPDEE